MVKVLITDLLLYYKYTISKQPESTFIGELKGRKKIIKKVYRKNIKYTENKIYCKPKQ